MCVPYARLRRRGSSGSCEVYPTGSDNENMQTKESRYDIGVACHVLCGGAHVNETNFTDFQRLIVVWQTRRAYTMEGWSDDLARSKTIPIVSEPQHDSEDQWCVSKGLAKVGMAADYREEIESHLPSSATTMTLRYSSNRFRLFSDVPNDISWFHIYIEGVYDQIKAKFEHEPSSYLPIRYVVKRGVPGSIRGWTASGEIGVEAGDFVQNRWCLVISAQELVNLFTGSICSGWPTDWWANHRSPFPIMVAVEVVRDLGYLQEANEYDAEFEKDPLYMWHKKVKGTLGWSLYRKMFSAMREDGIQLDRIGSNPSRIRTNYVLAYMGIGAGGFYLNSANGTIPDADQKIVEELIDIREQIQRIPRDNQRWLSYLDGNYR